MAGDLILQIYENGLTHFVRPNDIIGIYEDFIGNLEIILVYKSYDFENKKEIIIEKKFNRNEYPELLYYLGMKN